MDKVYDKLTVLFEDPFWVLVFERYSEDRLAVARYVFGAEPKDIEINEFIRRHYYDLKFSRELEAEFKEKKLSPKRKQREVRKTLAENGIGTKSQQALKLSHEQDKIERKQKCRQDREEAERLKFLQKQQKKKEKHRGR